ncbi:MAG: hypothetical protein ABIR96_10685 [Bdellovibrionota bacterium]
MPSITPSLRLLSLCAAVGLATHAHAFGAARPSQPSTPSAPSKPVEPTKPIDPGTPPDNSHETPADMASVISEISKIASASSCASYSWKNRGRAPAGYVNGMAVTFAKSLCRQRAGEGPAKLMASKNTANSEKDAITWFESTFDDAKLEIDVAGADTLRSLFTLGIGLGMRESSGKYCEGYDVSGGASNSAEAEAGPFQTSYNAVNASPELKKLYDEYKADPSKCFLDTFKQGVSCTARGFIGTGEGLTFQKLAKSCPAFAAEFAMTTLRVIRKHYGPINRKEAEINPSCNKMLDDVQTLVEDRSASVCDALN